MPWKTTPAPSDREQIRRYLGYPLSTVALNHLDLQMSATLMIGREDAVLTVQGFLAELTKIDSALNGARDKAGVADEAIVNEDNPADRSYYRGEQIRVLREEGRRLVREVSETLGLVVYRDVFSTIATTTIRRG